ncbi:DUF4328 domain-containing protein [Streptomyces sp. NPDC058637]|uniref:DUF4328 domain-containing protein n=1 Tax=Streptomyces sp. NPDC058637 TaxID=3346569 RepID=UPI0036554ECC
MLCTTCRTRPVAVAGGRCTTCAALRPSPRDGLMTATPAPTQEGLHLLRSPEGLAKAVVALLVAVIVADVSAVAAGLNTRGVFADIAGGDLEAFGLTTRADLLNQRAYSLQLLTLLPAAVVFILWFRRVRLNAEVFDASQQTMKPGWAVGGWFVPVGNFWLPRRVAGGIWTASAQTNTDGSWRTVSHAPLNLWWAAWVLDLLFGRYASRKYERAELPQEVVDAAGLVVASDVLDIVAAVLAILFVRRLTAMQGERATLGAYPLSTRPAGPGGHHR